MSCLLLTIPVVVVLTSFQAPVADHARDAVRNGQPRILHVERDHDEERRKAALRGEPTRKGFDRDEYPPAQSIEGGKGADVRLVPSGPNRSAGSAQGRALAPFCDGQAFVLGA